MMNNAEKLAYSMFQMGDRVLVGLSGGADSVALLCLLNSLKEALSLTVYACHINHGIRGEEAKRDELFCKELCEKMGIEFFCERISVPEIASRRKCSEETAGREERYRIFQELAKKKGAKIATAHNRDDLAETVIFNIIRGSSAKGVVSLKPIRENIYRPLLDTSRKEIEEYLEKIGQCFVEDSTNSKEIYTRNKIRHNIIPILKEINPKALEHIARFSKTLREDCSYLDKKAKEVYQKTYEDGALSDELLRFDAALVTRALALFLEQHGAEVSYDNIKSLKDILSSSGKVNLSGNVLFQKRGHKLFKITEEENIERTRLSEGSFKFGKVKITLSFVDLKGKKDYNKFYGVLRLDADKISGDICLRSREEGDKFRPKGRPSKTLKKFFNEQKIPAEKRPIVPIIEDEKGIVAVLPYAIDERLAPDDMTKRLLIIETDMRTEE